MRTALIKMSMIMGILLSDGTAIPFLPFLNSIGFPPYRTKRYRIHQRLPATKAKRAAEDASSCRSHAGSRRVCG
jgi:hypothetical protein